MSWTCAVFLGAEAHANRIKKLKEKRRKGRKGEKRKNFLLPVKTD